MLTFQIYNSISNEVTNNGLTRHEASVLLEETKNVDLKVAFLTQDGRYYNSATGESLHLKFPH